MTQSRRGVDDGGGSEDRCPTSQAWVQLVRSRGRAYRRAMRGPPVRLQFVRMAGLVQLVARFGTRPQPVMTRKTRVCAFDRCCARVRVSQRHSPRSSPRWSRICTKRSDALGPGTGTICVSGALARRVVEACGATRSGGRRMSWAWWRSTPAPSGGAHRPGAVESDHRGRRARKATQPSDLHRASLARHKPFEADSQELDGLLSRRHRKTRPPPVQKGIRPQFFTPDDSQAKAALLWGLDNHQYDGADHHRLGAMPLVALVDSGIPFSYDNEHRPPANGSPSCAGK